LRNCCLSRLPCHSQKWQAQWQQQPTNDEGAILKREWWQVWEKDEPPIVEYIIQSYDTAYSKKETADFSVITTWGVFQPSEDSGPNLILLDVKRGRWDFPELKRIAKDEYDHWQPDNVLIEAKATGVTLQQELRERWEFLSPCTHRVVGERALTRSAVPTLWLRYWRPAWYGPRTVSGQKPLVEECAAFPNGDNDDMVDSTTQALMRFRSGNFISLHTDDKEEDAVPDLVPEYY
jgi:phage terminase large subunit-like protein